LKKTSGTTDNNTIRFQSPNSTLLQRVVGDLLEAEREGELDTCIIIFEDGGGDSPNYYRSGEPEHCFYLAEVVKWSILNDDLAEAEEVVEQQKPEEEIEFVPEEGEEGE
jgi:hypothetical protein